MLKFRDVGSEGSRCRREQVSLRASVGIFPQALELVERASIWLWARRLEEDRGEDEAQAQAQAERKQDKRSILRWRKFNSSKTTRLPTPSYTSCCKRRQEFYWLHSTPRNRPISTPYTKLLPIYCLSSYFNIKFSLNSACYLLFHWATRPDQTRPSSLVHQCGI